MSELKIIKMTDKDKTKVVTCSHSGCEQLLEVTTFLQESKAKCPRHGGKIAGSKQTPRIAVYADEGGTGSPYMPPEPTADTKPNENLADLRCPLCGKPLKILQAQRFRLVFKCIESRCDTGVTVHVNSSHMLPTDIPERWREVIALFNDGQRNLFLSEKENETPGT